MNGSVRSILPDFDVFSAPGVDVPPGAMTEASAGLGKSRLFALSPVVAAVRGLGDDAVASPTASSGGAITSWETGYYIYLVAMLSAVGFLSYQAGKAIAPSKAQQPTWGWIGVPVGLFTGVVGLGVMGFVANRQKG